MKRTVAEPVKREKGKLGEFVSIAVPAILESMMMVVVASIDTKMISGLGGAAISAVSLTAQPKIFVLSIFFALGTAVSVFVAQARGRGNREEANGYFHSILWVALLLSVVLGSLLAFFAEPVMALCNRQADTMGMSAVFFRIVMGGMIFQTTSIILNAALRGLGKTNITLTSNLALAAVDILCNYLLIEGRCGFPRLEVAGNAFATVLGTAAACLVSLREILYREDFLSLRGFFVHRLNADGRRKTVASRSCADTSASMRVGERLSNICSKAGNVVFENLSTRLGFLITGIIVSLFPAQETAVYFVAMLLLNYTFSVGDGIQSAVVSLIGRSMGAEQYGELRQYVRIAIACGLAGAAALSAIYLLGAEWFFGLFFSDAESVAQGKAVVGIVAALTGAQMVRIISVAAMRGTGEMKIPRQIATVCVLFVNPGASYLLAWVLGYGVWGIWLASLMTQGVWLIASVVRMKKCLQALPSEA